MNDPMKVSSLTYSFFNLRYLALKSVQTSKPVKFQGVFQMSLASATRTKGTRVPFILNCVKNYIIYLTNKPIAFLRSDLVIDLKLERKPYRAMCQLRRS